MACVHFSYWVKGYDAVEVTPYRVYCWQADRQGGGWTLGIVNWYTAGKFPNSVAVGDTYDALRQTDRDVLGSKTIKYKLSDKQIWAAIGQKAGQKSKFEVMADQSARNTYYSATNNEYASSCFGLCQFYDIARAREVLRVLCVPSRATVLSPTSRCASMRAFIVTCSGSCLRAFIGNVGGFVGGPPYTTIRSGFVGPPPYTTIRSDTKPHTHTVLLPWLQIYHPDKLQHGMALDECVSIAEAPSL